MGVLETDDRAAAAAAAAASSDADWEGEGRRTPAEGTHTHTHLVPVADLSKDLVLFLMRCGNGLGP